MVYLATSLPPPGSLTPIADTTSPAMAGSRNSFFSLSEPNLGNINKFTSSFKCN